MKKKYLIYCCLGIDSVFDSQVLELIISLDEKKAFEKVYLLLGIRNQLEVEKFQQRSIPKGIEVIIFKAYHNYAIFNFLSRKAISVALKKLNLIIEESVFHTRGEIFAWHLRKILNKKFHNQILPDVRGATLEELKENHKLKLFQMYLKTWNFKKALNNIKYFPKITVVSATLKEYLLKETDIKSEKIIVTPDLAGKEFKFDQTQRIEIRKALNIKVDEILLLFSSGHILEWQNWQNTNTLKLLADKGVKILNLSRNKIQHKNIINKFVEYSDMPLYLNGADIAVLWSDKRIVSEVRSPVKFSEYICCGLPIIANDSVDMVTDYIKNSQFGLLLENLDELDHNKINRLVSLNRQEISSKGIEWLGIESISQKYLKIYSSY